MEDSAFSSLMISVYVIIFVIASSITIYLFTTTVEFADKAYEYGKTNVGNSVVETTAAPQYNTVTGAELLTYYYNYKSPDKYGTAAALKYDFQNIDQIDINKTYTLIYESANTNANPVIKVVEVGTVSDTNPGAPIVIDKRPSDPTITTIPSTGGVLVPNTIVEFEARSAVNYSFLTNTIAKYYWKIEYSPEDGRSDFTTTTIGAIGKLQYNNLAAALKFKIGINTVYVTAEDSFGNKSNTISKNIELGYRDPVINSIREASGKVTNNGNIDIESPSGVALNFVGDAVSKNMGGYIQRYDWYVDNVLVQSSSNQALGKSFIPGTYNVKLVVKDSIHGTAEGLFKFTVNQIPAPLIACSNTAITTNHTLGIPNTTENLTFNSSLAANYGIAKYVWTIDGGNFETYVPNGINLNYGVGAHSISVYGVTSGGIRSTSSTLNFTLTQDFIPFEREYTYNGSYYTETLPAGKYKFEVWGAKGGNGAGGNGAYSQGELNLATTRTVYIYVGGSNGYNGGGSSRLAYSYGGGATDIRIGDTTSTYRTYYNISFANGGLHDDPNAQHFHGPYEKLKKGIYQVDVNGSNLDYIGEVWACTDIGATRFGIRNLVRTNTHISYYVVVPNDDDLMELNVLQYNPSTKSNINITNITASRLDDRIIVAGGGGGNGGYSIFVLGGSAGGFTGYTGMDNFGDPGTGGTQTHGGLAGRLNFYGATNGSFGIGGNAETASSTSAGAGGGGYYGGGGASSDFSRFDNLNDSGGGGGSSFISGYAGCNAVDVNGNHTWQPNHYSGLVFINSSMTDGINTGDGKAKITHIR